MSYERRKKTARDFSLLFFQKVSIVPLIVVGGALVAFVFWTIPSWGIVGPNLPQFLVLWQDTANRLVLFILTIKLISPALIVFVGLLLATDNQLSAWIKPVSTSILQHGTPPAPQPIVQRAPLRVVRIPISQEVPTSRNMAAVAALTEVESMQQESQPNPLTPLPPTGDDFPLLVQGRVISVQDEQYDAATHVPLETLEARASLPEAPSHQERVADEDAQKQAPALPPSEGEQQSYTIQIWLLKRARMTIKTSLGSSYDVPLPLNAKRVQLLAYIAWRRGEIVDRVKMLEQVFGHGRDDEDSTMDKLGEAFDSHKKLIRKPLRETIQQVNTQAGSVLIPSDLDIFPHGGKQESQYWLSEVCRVVDLEEIEQLHQRIEQARTDKRIDEQSVFACLFNEAARKKNTLPAIPDDIKAACDRLIYAYSGDFLGDVIQNYLDDFEPWPSSWAREPYTMFRDYSFQALWYAAEYELRRSLLCTSENEVQKHWEWAATYYQKYALRACNTRFDTKVTFGGGHGERVRMSERALRRMLVLYGALGATHLIDQVYTSYRKQMLRISAKAWQPSRETLLDYRAAKKQTGEYRFPNQSSDGSLPGQEDELDGTEQREGVIDPS
jgi:hypothetical protein